MANKKTLEKLASRYGGLSVHYDIKELIPESDAQLLLDCGFSDVSWSDDECPSYDLDQNPLADPISLYVLRDLDDEGNLLSDDILYTTYAYIDNIEHTPIPTNNLVKMIKQYKLLIAMADNRIKSEAN